MIDKTEIMLQSMSNDINDINERLAFFEAMFTQLLMGLSEAGVIHLDDGSGDDEEPPTSPILTP